MKDYSVKPYPRCKGLKWRKQKYWRKHHRPLAISFLNKIDNIYFTEKNKIRFIEQFFRWFIKAPEGFKVNAFLKEPYTSKHKTYKLNECDFITVSCRTYKAAWKNLLVKLNYQQVDYDVLRQRTKYTLYFTFFFSNLTFKSKEIMLDIVSTKYNCYKIFMVVDGYYIAHFKHILENVKLWD